MIHQLAKHEFEKMSHVVGIEINGEKPWDIQIENYNQFIQSIIQAGTKWMADEYVRGNWKTQDLEWLFQRYTSPEGDSVKFKSATYKLATLKWDIKNFCARTIATAISPLPFSVRYSKKIWRLFPKPENVSSHYNIGNDFYEILLNSPKIHDIEQFTWKYTSWIWKESWWEFNLNLSQMADIWYIMELANIKSHHTVGDIGCWFEYIWNTIHNSTWAKVEGVTIAEEQKKQGDYITEHNWNEKGVKIALRNWIDSRKTWEFNGRYDRLISVEMIEAVSTIQMWDFAKHCYDLLKPWGKMVIQFINARQLAHQTDNFYKHYIFEDGVIHQVSNLCTHFEKAWFNIVYIDNTHWESYGYTSRTWWNNLREKYSKLWGKYDYYYNNHPRSTYNGEKASFFPIQELYLNGFTAGSFMSGKNRVWHIVLEKWNTEQTPNVQLPETLDELKNVLSTLEFPDIPTDFAKAS